MPTSANPQSRRMLAYTLVALGILACLLAFTETGSELAFEISNFARDLLNLL
jgi:hypothetical protein